MTCSSGTYIRSLAADLGAALRGGAHLRDLRRTAIGSFTADQGVEVEALTVDALLTPAAALRDLRAVAVDAEVATAVGYGKVLPLEVLGVSGAGPWPLIDAEGTLLAVYEPHRGGGAKPSVVLASATGP